MKKETLVKVESYQNMDTGEVFEAHTKLITDDIVTDSNFMKVWAEDFLERFCQLSPHQQQIIKYMILKSKWNVFRGNQSDIAVHFGITRQTVNRTIQKAISLDILRKKNNREYLFNPLAIVRGSHKYRMQLLQEYKLLKHGDNELMVLELTNAKLYDEMIRAVKEVEKKLDLIEKNNARIAELKNLNQNKKDSF